MLLFVGYLKSEISIFYLKLVNLQPLNNNTVKKIILIILSFILSVSVHAQDNDTINRVQIFKGKLISQDDKPLAFAHVINLCKSYATVSDSAGRFRIVAEVDDSLRISTIGYKTRIYTINKITENEQVITLVKREYNLPVINIYELRWHVFKSEFMEQVSEDAATARKIEGWLDNLVSVEELRLIYQSTTRSGIMFNYKSKADKSKMKVRKMEKKYRIIAPKFNDELISNLTGLKSEEIYKFLRYCNFSEDFLINASEYEIMEQILVFWQEYKNKNNIKGGQMLKIKSPY